MEQAAVKRKKVIVPFLIGLLLLSSIVFIKHLMNRMNSYIEKNGKMSMGTFGFAVAWYAAGLR